MIEYRPIPGMTGIVALSIREPGEWFGRSGYVPFIGGSGIGEAKTEEQARRLLLSAAKDHCRRQIKIAELTREHYMKQLEYLDHKGLGSGQHRKEQS